MKFQLLPHIVYRYAILSFYLLCSYSFILAQNTDTALQIIYELESPVYFVTTDALQQIYIATKDGRILKLDKNGKPLFEYNNKRLGKVGVIDASNPFNVLVYYPELATVILLDRTLSELKSINLFDLNIFEPQAVALSNDNHIWVYDPINYQLKKISGEVILFQSKRLNQAIDTIIYPTFLLERNNLLLLADTTNGIFIFDTFGQLKKHISIRGVSQFQVLNNQLVYFKNQYLYRYPLGALEEQPISSLPFANNVLVLPERWIIMEKEKVSIAVKE